MRYSVLLLAATMTLAGCLENVELNDSNKVANAQSNAEATTLIIEVEAEHARSRGTRSSQGIDEDINARRLNALLEKQQQRLQTDARSQINTKFAGKAREDRTLNGYANNQVNPDWGSTFQHLERVCPADYSDGIAAIGGANRKSPREISNILMGQADGEDVPNSFGTSDFVWQWGQFLDHDLDLTDGSDTEAQPIPVPIGDEHLDPFSVGGKVISFNRAAYDPATGIDINNPREQENEITAWIDGSMIYGTTQTRAEALRKPGTPFLKTSANKLLPFNENSLPNANGFIPDPTSLFLAGDVRANEQVGLTTMHTLFVREHNRWAKYLKKVYPQKTADEIFESARRLVIAEIQKITFEEFLPALIGTDSLNEYQAYDASVNPNIMNEFSVAAYRLGHSMVSDRLLRLNRRGKPIKGGHLTLRQSFFTAPMVLQKRNDIDPILRGLASQEHQALDLKIVNNLRNFLFALPGMGGLDLASLNIQRGRDHGIGSYNDAREEMGMERRTQFSEVSSDPEIQNLLSQAYETVDDIDLWVGGLAEDADLASGSQVGELFRKILAKQFLALRDGDRFWYQGDYLDFREKRWISNMTLARVIRNNTTIGNEIQDNVFYVPAD